MPTGVFISDKEPLSRVEGKALQFFKNCTKFHASSIILKINYGFQVYLFMVSVMLVNYI